MYVVPDHIVFSIALGDEQVPITVEAFVKATLVAKSVYITVAGYDDDPRELWEIPEVSDFLRKFTAKAKLAQANFSALDDISKALLLHACGKAEVMRKHDGGAFFHIFADF
jgi:hypothetical protein